MCVIPFILLMQRKEYIRQDARRQTSARCRTRNPSIERINEATDDRTQVPRNSPNATHQTDQSILPTPSIQL